MNFFTNSYHFYWLMIACLLGTLTTRIWSQQRPGCLTSQCSDNHFQCENCRCILKSWLCNHNNDCGDGSDEHANCTYSLCSGHEFTCKNRRCIDQSWLCDGSDDCIDGSDEVGCHKNVCPDWQWTCPDSGKCIPITKVCDGSKDCDDGSDEGSSCSSLHCSWLFCVHACQRTPSGGQCYCPVGMALDLADNRTCIDFDECSNWGYCDQKCVNQAGSYKCSCYDGYTSKGDKYCAVNNSDSMLLFVGTDKRIFSVNSTGGNIQLKVSSFALDIEFSYARNKMYWIDDKFKVFQANIDGSNKTELPVTTLGLPIRLALDWKTNNLYFLDRQRRIGIYCLDTGYQQSIITNDIKQAIGLAIDPNTGFLFFSEARENLRTMGRIIRAFMDGSHQVTLPIDKIINPIYLTLDIVNQRLYWIDYYLDHIETVDYYGRFGHTIISGGLNIPAPVSLTLFEDQAFWADVTKMGILKVNKYTGLSSVSQIFRNTEEKMKTIKVFHPSSQGSNFDNPCKNAKCEQICILTHASENAGLGYKCVCNTGYELMENQINCTKIEKFLLLACQYAVWGQPLTLSTSQAVDAIPPLLATSSYRKIYLTVDYTAADETIYFTEIYDSVIYKVHLNGTGLKPLLIHDIRTVESIVVDWISRNLYFTDFFAESISVIRIDHPEDRRELISGVGDPKALCIHLHKGWIFYANWFRSIKQNAYIARANTDGTNIIRIRQHELGWPNSLSIDYNSDRLYWTDIYFERIQHSDFDGNDVQTLNVHRKYYPLSLVIYEDSIYYTDWKLNSLFRVNKNGRGLTTIMSDRSYIMDVKVYDKQLQNLSGQNPCAQRNGDCSHFCFPVAVSRFNPILNSHCGCPYGMKLDINLRNCIPNPEETPKQGCQPSSFQCANKRCIWNHHVCDGENNCIDNSDEVNCTANRTCPPNTFQCKNFACINSDWVCDNDYDCSDRSDEFNCRENNECSEKEFRCNNSLCISHFLKCDTTDNCGDGSDEGPFCAEHTCLPNSFQCKNKLCISERLVCDGQNHCNDNSDEENCPKANCTDSEWMCLSEHQCIDNKKRCDRQPDCEDGSDETGCLSQPPNVCYADEFKCVEGGCIPGSWKCDGHEDCEDGSDENPTCSPPTCPGNLFRCDNGNCIYKSWICDGMNDCGDNSDEHQSLTCPPPPFACPYGQWECPLNTRICIPDAKVCDGNQDCPGGHDESPLCNKDSCQVSNGGCSNICLQTPLGAQCQCPLGEELNGTKLCMDKNECDPPGHCSQKCVNTIGSFKCQCEVGYQLLNDRRTCRIQRNETVPYIMGTRMNRILHLQVDSKTMNTFNVYGWRYLIHIAVHVANSSLYMYDITNKQIIRTNLDGKNLKPIITTGIGRIGGLAVDWISNNLYWTDKQLNTIQVATLSGTNRMILFKENNTRPSNIVLDPREGSRVFFWSNWVHNPHITRAGMDGKNRTVIVGEKIGRIRGLAIDYPNRYLYFISTLMEFIDYCDYDGKNRHRVLSSYTLLRSPRGLAVLEDRVYWSSISARKLYHCNKFKCKASDIDSFFIRSINDITTYSKVSQPSSSNPCFQSLCSHLCLLTPKNPGYKCACPTSMKLGNDGKNCVKVELEFLLYVAQDHITALQMTKNEYISLNLVGNFLDIDYDTKENYLYYIKKVNTNISVKKVKFVGSSSVDVWPNVFLNTPVAIATDWVSRNLFWVISKPPAIEVMRLDGDAPYHRKILGNNDKPTGVFKPTSICLDPIIGSVYWIDMGGGYVPKKIAEIKMNGTGSRILIKENLNEPAYLTKDPTASILYWSESYFGKIERYNIPQKHREVVLENLANPKGLTIYKGFLYYTQADALSISKISLTALENGGVIIKKEIHQLQTLKMVYARYLNQTNSCAGSNYGGCSQLCLPNGLNSHSCECSTGLSKNAQGTCTAGSSFLVVVTKTRIQGFSLQSDDHPEAMVPLAISSHNTYVAPYPKGNYIYLSSFDKCSKFRPDGTKLETIKYDSSTHFGISAMAVDWVAGNLYFRTTSWVSDLIEVGRLNGTNRLVLLEDLHLVFYSICVNPIKRYIYWTGVGLSPKLERANLDGSNRTVLVRNGIKRPLSITLDIVTHDVYWVDSLIDALQRISYNGGNRQYVRSNLVTPIGVAVFGDNVYWADYTMLKIFSVPKNSKVGAPSVVKSRFMSLLEVSVFDAATQPTVSNPCSENYGGCEQLCFSLPNNSTAVCKCATGQLAPDGRKCTSPSEFLIFTTALEIRSIFLDLSVRSQPFPPVKNLNQPLSLDYDYSENYIYFSHRSSTKLSRAKKGSTVVEDIVYISNNTNSSNRNSRNLLGIAVDWVSKKLYWTDYSINKIMAMNFDFNHKVTLVHVNSPRAIVLNPCKGYMYWTSPGKIERATMAGNQRTAIITSGLSNPTGLAIDYEDEKIFWSDLDLKKIERSNLEGNYREVIIEVDIEPYSLTVFGNHIYWTDLSLFGIMRAEKHTGLNKEILIGHLKSMPLDLKVFADRQQTCKNDPCEIYNGGCSHGCHPAPDGKAECSCDDNSELVLANNQKMCVPKANNCTSAHFICMNGKCIYKRWICDIDDDCGDGSDENRNLCADHTCEPSMFRCDNGRCIRPYFRCDYDNDCRDNSDERDCSHPTCGPNEFECKNYRCISQHRVCDGYDHCHDGFQTDEQNCPSNITCMTGLVKCPNNSICLNSRFLCDGDNDCGDNSDENIMFCQSVACSPGDFYCSNRHRCIPGVWLCDGDDDCGDMEDEPESCNSENRTCYDNLFSCDNGKCIAQHWVCDGDNDCLDGSDEAESLRCAERTCPPTYFTCKSNLQIGTSPCISHQFVCDGVKNCVAGEDEMQSCPARTCSEDQFVCDNGFCIMSPFYCDHDNDCGDNSDEPPTCEYPSCSDDQFTCDNQRCVPSRWVCDMDNDCLDHSDEKASMCFTPAPTCPPGEFLCKNGECIDYSIVCNKQPDCSDNSDEEHCYINECERTEMNQCQHKCVDTITSFHCECHSGFTLMNDKKACRDVDECLDTPEVCSQYCLNTVGNYTCKCNDGYQKENKHQCKRKDNIKPWLVFSNGYYIRELSTDAQIYRRVAQDFESVVTMDFDYAEQRLYYIDYINQHIQRMFLNGTNRETIVRYHVPHGEGIAVDWVGRKLYWVDFFFARMYVCELNGTSRATLLTRSSPNQNGLNRPRAVVVNPSYGYLYWTDWGVNPYIGRIGMDGSGYTHLITEKLGWPNGLTIDYETNRLWWADAHFDYIEYANADGTNRHVVIQGDLPHAYAITVFEDWIYWTDLSQNSIEKANKYTGANRVIMKNTTHHPFDICVIHPLRQKSHPNPCGPNNGGCSHLCLLAPENKYRCLCPDNFFLNSDNHTCIANCSSSQFRCGVTDDRCIPLIWKCDGEKDCKDGIDEPDDCPNSKCPSGQFQCKNENCTFLMNVCDKRDDCGDGSDEEDCDKHPCPLTQWKCKNNKCIHYSWQCDGEDDCGDGSDEPPEKCVNKTCSPSQFTCTNGACISLWWKCDFDHDCLDGSDESPDLNCANRTCPEGWFKCATNYRCVPQSYVCDGEDDCRDNSDEASENCESCSSGMYQCDNNQCIPKQWLCDFGNDCKDGSDEKASVCKGKYRSCSESEFQCKNEKCIQGKWRCDYDNDCGDESDEENCGKITCPEDTFRCNEGFCVHQSVTCDGHRDCKDVSDELNCTARYPNGKYCPSNVFECKNTICIPLKWRCDGTDDCGDGSDEVVSVCKEVDCPSNTHFRCDNFKCIPRWRLCNNVNDCGDSSDENNPKLCQPVQPRCEANQFKCANKQCIDSSKVCDDFLDCEDSSDERGCHKTSGAVNCSVNNGGCAHNCTDLKGGGFYCSCRNGYKVSVINRKECEDVDECAQWGNDCPQVCNNLKGTFKCTCQSGFHQSNFPVPKCKAYSLPSVFLTMGSDIRKFVYNTKYAELFSSHRPQALAGNPRHFTLYWTDSVLKSIHWVYIAYNSGPVIKLPITGIQEPNGIAVDWISGNIYWTDSGKKTISVAAYDGKYSHTLIRNGLRKPYAIITNSNTGWMYWTDIDSDRPTIERAWMNGEKREVLVSERLAYPSGITIDYFMEHRVFWCDAKFNVIESMKADGSDRVIVIQQGLQNPISLDVFEERLYWLSQNDGKLMRMDKFGRGANITLQSGLMLPRNVKVFHVMKINQDVKSKCYEKSTCSHLCLLTPDTHKCACPDNSQLFPGSSTVCNAASETSIELAHCNCHNGGTCIQDADNKYACKCKEGFYGFDCSSLTPEKHIGELKYTKVTAVVVPVVLLLIIAAVSVGGFFFMKRRGKFFLNKPLIGAPSVPHTPLGVVSFRDGENVNIGTPPLSYDIMTSGQEINPLENEYSSPNPACPTNFSNPMYGVDHPTKMEQQQQPPKKAPSLPTSSLEKIESKSSEKPTDSQKKTSEAKPKNENYYVSLKTGKSFDPMEDTDKETASLVKIGEL